MLAGLLAGVHRAAPLRWRGRAQERNRLSPRGAPAGCVTLQRADVARR